MSVDQLSLAPDAPIKARNRKISLRRIEVEGASSASVDRDLVESIRVHGLLEPVILEPRGEFFHVIDGRRRTLAAYAAGLKSVPARIIEVDGWMGRQVLSILLNEQRGPNPVSELQAIVHMVKMGKTESEIARATGMDVATIRKRLKLTKLISSLRAAFEAGYIKPPLAESIAALPPELQLQLAHRFLEADKKLTAADVHAVREVRHAAATGPLANALAQTPATTQREPQSWRESVNDLLGQAIEMIPNGEGWAWEPLAQVHSQLTAAIQEGIN